jgi:hypothetical protein
MDSSTPLVYVNDARRDRTWVFSPSGQFAMWWGARGAADGPENERSGIAVNFPFVYIAETRAHCIREFRFDEIPADVSDGVLPLYSR